MERNWKLLLSEVVSVQKALTGIGSEKVSTIGCVTESTSVPFSGETESSFTVFTLYDQKQSSCTDAES
jgi:hypothetical protein